MLPERWPELALMVHPQATVAITLATDPGKCLLRLLAPMDPSDRWPGSPHSVIGNAVHALLHRITSGDPEQRAALASDTSIMESAFLEEVFAKGEFKDPEAFQNWLKSLPSEFWEGAQQALMRGIHQVREIYSTESIAQTVTQRWGQQATSSRPFEQINFMNRGAWSEIPCESAELGIKGRCDLIVSDGSGNIRVDDFKAGSLNGNSEKIHRFSRQVLMYLTLLRLKHPTAALSGRLVAADGIQEIDADAMRLDSIENELRQAKALWPTAQTDSRTISEIGEQCTSCRLRHRCPSYRASEPWMEGPDSPFQAKSWNQDVWGEVFKVHKGIFYHSVAIRTTDGALAIINGLDPNRNLGDLMPNQQVGFFGMIKGKSWRPETPEFVENHPDGRKAWSMKVFVERVPG